VYALLPIDGVFDEADARIQCIFTRSFAGVTYAEIALPTLHMKASLVDQSKARLGVPGNR
jgi:hypothetical protein